MYAAFRLQWGNYVDYTVESSPSGKQLRSIMFSHTRTTICAIALLAVLVVFSSTVNASAQSMYVRHFVSIKFKETTSPQQVEEVLTAFQNMKSGIPEIVAMEWGPDVSIEKRNKGFTHAFLLTFASEKDRDTYLVHPVHTKFLAFVKPLMEDIFVFDFLATPPAK